MANSKREQERERLEQGVSGLLNNGRRPGTNLPPLMAPASKNMYKIKPERLDVCQGRPCKPLPSFRGWKQPRISWGCHPRGIRKAVLTSGDDELLQTLVRL